MQESSISERIKELRTDLKMNQKNFSAAIGIRQSTLSSYENGVVTPSNEVLLTIAQKFHISLDWLFGLSENKIQISTLSDVILVLLQMNESNELRYELDINNKLPGDIETESVILATGSKRAASSIPGIREYEGKGVSYCAICDAFFYRGKQVAVLGNSDFALHEAEQLKNVTPSVTIYTNGEKPEFSREHDIQVNTMKIQSVEGENTVSGLRMEQDMSTLESDGQKESFYPADGIFVALGTAGSTEIARQMGAELTEKGNINQEMETTIPGLFAAGDCTGGLLQVATAVSEGCAAGISAGKYIRRKFKK